MGARLRCRPGWAAGLHAALRRMVLDGAHAPDPRRPLRAAPAGGRGPAADHGDPGVHGHGLGRKRDGEPSATMGARCRHLRGLRLGLPRYAEVGDGLPRGRARGGHLPPAPSRLLRDAGGALRGLRRDLLAVLRRRDRHTRGADRLHHLRLWQQSGHEHALHGHPRNGTPGGPRRGDQQDQRRQLRIHVPAARQFRLCGAVHG
mmetsp:Transcript_36388/g.113379  ORF Transcript_36388/g.113379 Transcript_36388/m.113379 type:complete len:203 (-) Transcript_36388:226-834(-)